MKYRNKVTLLSFALSILVVIRHSINIDIYGLESGVLYWLQAFAREASDLAVPSFFMLSGYLFFQNYQPNMLISKWKSRVYSILIPYLAWNILAYLYYEVIYMIPIVSRNMTQSIEPLNFEWLVKNMIFGYHNITWFLQNLMAYVLIVPLMYPLLRNKIGSILLIIATFFVGILEQNTYGLAYNGVFYLMGAYIGVHHREIVQKQYCSRYIIFAAAVLVLSVILNISGTLLSDTLRMPVRIVQVILLWVAADALAVDYTPKWWMKLSFVIYCSHSMILESVEKIFMIVFKNTLMGATIDFILAPVITLCIICCISVVLRRIKVVWCILSGNR